MTRSSSASASLPLPDRVRVVPRERVRSASVPSASRSPRAAKNSNVPTRMWLAATRVSTAPGSTSSRTTGSPVVTAASARVVGTPSAAIASLTTYSRSTGPSAARPSPPRENGVRPAPLSWMSRRLPSLPTTSPSRIARPSPSCGTKLPNWCPAYASAIGSAPSGSALPASICAPSRERRAVRRRAPSSSASARLTFTTRGALTCVGATRA